MKKIPNYIIAILGIIISLYSSWYWIWWESWMHFPGGHLTEYDQFFIKWLFLPFESISGLFLLLFAISLFRYKKAKNTKRFLLFYILILLVILIIDEVFYLNLEHGQGG